MTDPTPNPTRRTFALMAAAAVMAGSVAEAGAAARAVVKPNSVTSAGAVTLLFLPFAGLPTTTADDIYRDVRELAAKEGLKLVLRLDEPANYRVKASFSAVGAISSTTIVYRIEIVDPAGRRLHQAIGQEIGPTSAGDPWAGIDKATVKHLAISIVDVVKAWVTRDGA